ncbi:MAG TPA: adenylate/guanylate cyclase domain-containing protein [Thermoanaerobaculia bacterium]|jgi:class 3 adenylate cyclase/tetratricopeptide (TPR) repeat protein
MKCAQCQFDNPEAMKFCGQCGSKLARLCPQCGVEAPPGFKFCGECGSSLAAPEAATAPSPDPVAQRPATASAPTAAAVHSYTPAHLSEQVLQSKTALEGERKQVTVLFCDLVSSTALADRIGPEAMHLLLNRFFELALGEIHRYEGTINQFLGDGFMALFGAPIAHEDHPMRAVLAALGLQRRLQEDRNDLGQSLSGDLAIRMGVNTGWVVVGGIGDHLRMDYTAVGDTTNLAARLQQSAEPGSVLISEATQRMLQGAVLLEPLPPLQVKGKVEPIRAFKVLGLGTRSEQAVLSGGLLSPFVGRERELAVLEEMRDQAAAGEGQIIGIAGEAGSGKSRLLYEFRSRSWGRPGVYLSGRCLSYGGGVPYLPLLHLFRNHWGIAETDGPGAAAAKIRVHLEAAGLDPGESLPYLLLLLGIRTGAEALAGLSPQALQARTFTILRQMLLNAGQGGLVIVEIEDLHWIDETSEDFLSHLIEGLVVSPVLLLLTYRSGYPSRWMEKSYATQISMRRLTARDSLEVVSSVLRRAKLPEDLARAVLDKAEGNPFFLEELTRSIVERSSLADVSVPDTIQGVLMARIDRLQEEHKRLLQTASVLGREFPRDLLEAIWEHPGTAGPLLEDLKRWEFLYEAPAMEPPLYFFKHALTQEAVYQSLLTGRRQALHLAAGLALESFHADRLEDIYDSLAVHFPKSGDAPRAVHYLSLFAARAAGAYAHAEAAKALREALVHAERLPAGERDRKVLELILQLADSLLPLARFPETLELFLRHREAVDRAADPGLAGRYFFWLAHTYSYLGNQAEAAAAAERAIEAARLCGDQATEGKAFYVLSRDGFWSGQFSRGIECSLKAVSLLEGSEDRWWQGQAWWVAGFNHYALGRFEQALEAMCRVHAIWKALADPRLDASWSTGYFYASLGDWERGIEECQGGLERAQDPLNTSAALGFLGYAYLEKRDLPQAVEALEDSVRRMEQAGMQQLLGWFAAFLAEAYLYAGRLDAAGELARRALAATTAVEFGYGSGLARRALGRVARAQGDPAAARRWLEEAQEGFLALRVPFEVARTRLDLAELTHSEGLSTEAAGLLEEARRTFSELRVSRYAERTERMAEEMALPLKPPAASPAAVARTA